MLDSEDNGLYDAGFDEADLVLRHANVVDPNANVGHAPVEYVFEEVGKKKKKGKEINKKEI